MPNIYDYSDGAIENQIGSFLKDSRIKMNYTQGEAAKLSGLHRNTVSQIERGAGGTIASLVQLLRTYKKLDLIEVMKPEPIKLSPIQALKLERKHKLKVRHSSKVK